jgi:hypothetical protein
MGEIAPVEVFEVEIVAVLELLMAHGRGDLEVRDHRAFGLAEREAEDQLVLEHPGVRHLGEAVCVLVHVVQGLVEALVGELHAVRQIPHEVEVERDDVVLQRVVLLHEHVAAAQLRGARVEQPHVRVVVQDVDDFRGRQRRGGEDERADVAGDGFVRVQQAVPVGIERGGAAGDVGAVVHQVLREPVPPGHLVALEVVIHAAELGAQRIADVHVEGHLVDALFGVRVVVVAVRVLGLGVEVVAHLPAHERRGPADLAVQDLLVPRPEADAELAPGRVEELPVGGAGRLGDEVEVAADLRGAVDGRCRAAHHVDAVAGADGGGVVAGVVDALHAAEVIFARCAANVEGACDAEEGLREGAWRQRDEVVDLGDDDLVQHLVADGRDRARRLDRGLAEAEHGFDPFGGQHLQAVRRDLDGLQVPIRGALLRPRQLRNQGAGSNHHRDVAANAERQERTFHFVDSPNS